MMNVMKVNSYFEQLGMQVDEVQADDPSVGITEGWVTFRRTEKHRWMEIGYSDAVWHMKKKHNWRQILKESKINII